MKTHLYLDVDGVFNAVTLAETPRWGWDTPAERVTVDGWAVTYNPALVAAVNDIAALDHVTVHWLTTWSTRAAELLSPAIGLEHGSAWEVLGQEDQYDPAHRLHWWKLPAIRRHVEATAPDVAIWVDDDISFDAEACEWASTRDELLVISPRTDLGITRREMDLVDRAVSL